MKHLLILIVLLASSFAQALDIAGLTGGEPSFLWELRSASSFSHLPGPAITDKAYWKFIIGGCLQNLGEVRCKVKVENTLRGEYDLRCRATINHKDSITGAVVAAELSAETSVQDRDREWYNRMSFGLGDRLVPVRRDTVQRIQEFALRATTPGMERLARDLACR